MLFKLSLSNIRRSLRDYAIYFFTLIIGVSVFYVFNAIGSQAAYMKMSEGRNDIIELLTGMLSGVSVFVACVLGLLVVYASRFLMKRRNKEFALYLMLGMSRAKISAILLIETVIIGLGSLVVGLGIGIGLSQLMSALVANLFEADMTAYKFTISGEAIGKTILYFAVMYLIVMIFNSLIISRFKLIDLLQSGKKSEQIKLKKPVLCVFVFIIASILLGYAYYQVGWNYNDLNGNKLLAYIAVGAFSTFLIFWSVSGMLLRVVMSMKNVYYRGLNSFTFRQISSKVNTMVFSMSVICLMLFVTICTLSAAFSIRNSMNANLRTLCPADFEIKYREYDYEKFVHADADVSEVYARYGYDIDDYLSESVHFCTYIDENFTFADYLGNRMELVKISDYNALMELYGKESLSMGDGEFILICDYKPSKRMLNEVFEVKKEITVFGQTLNSKYDKCQDGFIEISSQTINAGIFIVPDNVVDDDCTSADYIIGNYKGGTKEEKAEVERIVQSIAKKVHENILTDIENGTLQNGIFIRLNTKIDISESTIGLGAIVTFIGLYLGLVFLIACGAMLALKELSESVDSIERYEMLRKIGAEEKDISKSLFHQTGIFFLLPLLLACIHSVFGMKFGMYFLEMFGTEKLLESIFFSSLIILLIYGGYFLITYFCSKGIIKKK